MASTRFDRVVEGIRSRVESREWPPGHRIPSTAGLATLFGVGTTTVRDAVRALSREGLLIGDPGVGVFVAGDPPND